MMNAIVRPASLVVWCVMASYGQSTQGIIVGRIYDIRTAKGIGAGQVFCTELRTKQRHKATSNADGNFILTLVSPGTYYCRAQSAGTSPASAYQPRETYGLELPVAGRLELDFPLRSASDVYDQELYADGFSGDPGIVVHVFAADVRTTRSAPLKVVQAQTSQLEATVSNVFSPGEIQDLPLAGRDIYSLLITQPGVTSDAATARSLGLSANGQRPSASNFLLDGLENNNSLTTGPLTTPNPEAIQEYRVSTTLYAAEYGRTAGYLANAITRTGTDAWHGVAYFHIKNDALNASDFQRKIKQLPRTPLKEINPGFATGGPILRNKLFASGSFDYTRFRSFDDPVAVFLPTSAFHPMSGSIAQELLQLYPPPPISFSNPSAKVSLSPTFSLDHYLALARLDYVPGSGKHRVTGRVVVDRNSRPDFLWTPYQQFNMPLFQNALSAAATWTVSSASGLSQELRAGWNSGEIRFDRPHPEVPTLQSGDGTILPGSPALYGFRNLGRDVEIVENVAWVRGAHQPKFGGGVLFHHVDDYLTLGRDRIYAFGNLSAFGMDHSLGLYLPLPRADATTASSSSLPVPDYNRTYVQRQVYLFAQDNWRVSPQFIVNYGLRYDNFGAPRNIGSTQDARLILGSGSSFVERLQNAYIDYPKGSHLRAYDPDNRDFAARAGFSWSVRQDARTVVRGGYAMFYDRPFDNEWAVLQNNSVVLEYASSASQPTRYLPPFSPVVLADSSTFTRITFYQPGIRSPYTQNYFLGVQHQLTDNLTLSAGSFGSFARKLITTDALNRNYYLNTPGPFDFYRKDLPPISYRANQGSSSDNGLAVEARWRTSRSQFHMAWTWSHSIDNQSEPLAGDYYNLDYIGILRQGNIPSAAFTRQFDSNVDRGNSDFDQRHNFVFFSIWDLPSILQRSRLRMLFRNWKVSQLAAFRSGLPFTVIASGGADTLINNRANIIDPQNVWERQPVNGEVRLLNPAAFAKPGLFQVGNSGRNSFRAPGFYNIDFSLSRSFKLRALGEAGRAVLRADFFNVLNHANLGSPVPYLADPKFGIATYGRQGTTSGFPAAIPFQETARQIQLMLRIEF